MGVTPAYKQTEVGTIPSDWAVGSLGDLVDPRRTIRYGIVQPGRRDPNGRYMIRGQDYSRGWVDPSEVFRVSPVVEEPFINARVRAGDVLITIVGASTGRIAVVPAWLDGANLTQTTARIAPRTDRLDGAYCSHVLAGPIGSMQVSNYLKGAAQPGLNCGDIEKFLIPLPPLVEQRSIAKALSDGDALLAALDRLIAKKRDLRQAARQQLLTGRTRLPGFSTEWTPARFSELVRYERPDRYLVKSSDYAERGVTAVLTANKSFILGYTDEADGICDILPVIIFDDFTTDSKYVDFPFKVKSSAIKILRPRHSGVNLRFVAERMRLVRFSATEHKRYYISEYQHLELPTPDPEEQDAIAVVLSDMDAELTTLQARRDKVRDLKQAMMQELLTGKTRLPYGETVSA